MEKIDALNLQSRKNIYECISEYPGLNLSELSRKLSIPTSTLEYHLRYLKKRKLTTTSSKGSYIRFYADKKITSREKQIINILREEISLKIVLLLFLYPEYFSQRNISKYLKMRPAAISYHLNKLVELDIVERYKIKEDVLANHEIKRAEDVYEIRFKEIFGEYKYYINEKSKTERRKILSHISKLKYEDVSKQVPHGNEIVFKIKNSGEIYELIIKHRTSLDNIANVVLKWMDGWIESYMDTFVDALNTVFPGLGNNLLP